MTSTLRNLGLTPRVDAPLGLLLAGLAVVLFIAWPDQATEPNGSWYGVAIVRHVGLILIATAAGLRVPVHRAVERMRDVTDVALAWAATVPFEVVAWYGTAPSDALGWSLLSSLLLAVALYGVATFLAIVAAHGRVFWMMPLLVPAAAFGLGLLDVRTGPVFVLPWLLPFAPSWSATVVLGVVAVATLAVLSRRLRTVGAAS